MRLPDQTNRLPVNLLLLAATVFVGVLLFLLSDLAGGPKSTGVVVTDALFGSVFFGFLIFTSAVPGGVAYVLLLGKMAQRVSGVRLRAFALLLSPIVVLPLMLLVTGWWPLALALPYGVLVRLPKQNQLPLSSA